MQARIQIGRRSASSNIQRVVCRLMTGASPTTFSARLSLAKAWPIEYIYRERMLRILVLKVMITEDSAVELESSSVLARG